jgi:hypothetical protein
VVTEPPAQASCSNVTGVWRRANNLTAQFSFTNTNSVSVYLTSFSITWSAPNTRSLVQIGFKDQFIHGEISGLPTASGSYSTGVSGSGTELVPSSPSNKFTDLQFKFDGSPPVEESAYSVTAKFNIGCTITINH